ncbi:MAG: hypothetical protein M5R36_23470 [Deltaproteobacteria bacterium]|nr:hypothetical protein [Deltaproteobacteria bacterium]
MTANSRAVRLLLVVAIALLALDVGLRLAGHDEPTPAQADIVSGKNYFTTHSPDGRTVYLWYYDYSGAVTQKDAYVQFLGEIGVGGTFKKNQ